MKLPALIDYQQAVQTPHLAFTDEQLRQGIPRMTPLQVPDVASGGFALTFDISAGGQRFAVRCFHKETNNLQERYARIAEFVRRHVEFDFLVDVDYLVDGIQVNGQRYPIVRMPWIAGAPLSDWVEDNLHEPQALQSVRRQISSAVAKLRSLGVAHGDLQHGNILVSNDGAIRLIDYDGMYLPSLRDLGTSEQGHRHYQHPRRGDSFDSTIDVFSAHVLDLSLAALQYSPQLWDDFHNGVNLLLTASDFAAPDQSELFARLRRLEPVAKQTEWLKRACTTDFAFVPEVLDGSRINRPAVGGPLRSPYEPALIHAVDADALRDRHGDEVTVLGRVTSTKIHWRTGNKLAVNINFGDYRQADFTIVAFHSGASELRERFGSELTDLDGAWVSLTGLIELYKSRWSKQLTPQIQLRRARALRVLNAPQVEDLLRKASSRSDDDEPDERWDAEIPEPAWKDPPEPSTGRPGPRPSNRATSVDEVDDRLSQLYSAPKLSPKAPPTSQHPPTAQETSRSAAQGPVSRHFSSTPPQTSSPAPLSSPTRSTSKPPTAPPPVPPHLRRYPLPGSVPPPPPPNRSWHTTPPSGTRGHGRVFHSRHRSPRGILQRFLRFLGMD